MATYPRLLVSEIYVGIEDFQCQNWEGVGGTRTVGGAKALQEVWMVAKLFVPTQNGRHKYHGLTNQH